MVCGRRTLRDARHDSSHQPLRREGLRHATQSLEQGLEILEFGARGRIDAEQAIELQRLVGGCLAVKDGVHQLGSFEVSHISTSP
jgi:hypothetical protein